MLYEVITHFRLQRLAEIDQLHQLVAHGAHQRLDFQRELLGLRFDNSFIFLTNLENYSHMMALAIINETGNIRYIHQINRVGNVDVNGSYVHIV